jgi:4-alpha-glucanotransferase
MHKFGQFLFDRQWGALKRFAAERGVRVVGDVPIFVALDSADVWAHADQYLLDAHRRPTVVAGVPPDYFSEDGQHWGNPIYDWHRMAATGYAWWSARVARSLRQVDLLRLDHFRGFCQAWHIPAGETTARNGRWVDGPGRGLFDTLGRALGGLPLIAEDLGVITPDVVALRDALGLPGMRVIQFALDGPKSPHWPHNYVPNTVCYTGTHDNDTVAGWYAALNERDRNYLAQTLGQGGGDVAWNLMRAAWGSVAALAVAPLQDVLGMGGEARMNRPGIAEGNWRWRFRLDQFRPDAIGRVAELTTLYNRAPAAAR